MKKYLLLKFGLLFFAISFFVSCDLLPTSNKDVVTNNSPQEIIDADIAFSDMSRQVGIKKAFMEYMSDEGVLLRPGHVPIIGAVAIDYLSQVNDKDYVLSWKPSGGEIAKSGEMGFTYGIYELKINDETIKGTYVNVWKKQRSGTWKYVLNNTNQGLTETNE